MRQEKNASTLGEARLSNVLVKQKLNRAYIISVSRNTSAHNSAKNWLCDDEKK